METPEAQLDRSERVERIEASLLAHREALLKGVPEDHATWDRDDHLRALVVDLLDFHRRADKPGWWALYARCDMTDEELIDDVECLGCLTGVADRPPVADKQSFIHTFSYPEQETKLRVGKDCARTDTTQRLGEIVALDEETRLIGIKVGKKTSVPPTLSVGPTGPINSDVLRDGVWRFAESLEQVDGRFAAVRALLRK